MKKILTILIAAAACFAQAAAITWSSGTLKAPIDKDGTFGSANVGADVGAMTIWFFTSLADAEAFVNAGYNDTDPATLVFKSASDDSFAGIPAAYGGKTDGFANSVTYYTVAYVETKVTGLINPGVTDTWFMYSGIGSTKMPGTGDQTINFLNGNNMGGSSLWANEWTPVPEPATAALAFAGLALLIRRRK